MRSPQLQNAIEQVYAEFHGPKPAAIDGCPCCIKLTGVCRLLARDLRHVSSKDLSSYAASLFLTTGDESDFRYFLPRLLDIATTEDWWPSPPILLEKLKLAHWHTWAERDRATVKGAIDAWYVECLDADRHDGADIDELLCGIGRTDLPLDEYLAILAARPEALRAFFEIHADTFFKRGRLTNGPWRDNPVAELAVLDFLNLPAVRERLGN